MKTNITLSLDKRRAKKDGSYPIILRVSHNRKTIPISLGHFVRDADWDEKQRKVKNSCKAVGSVTRLNNLLEKKKSEAIDILTRLEDESRLQTLSIKEVKAELVHESKSLDFFEYGALLVNEMKEANKIGNSRTYEFTLKQVRKFNNGKDLKFLEINHAFLSRMERKHLAKGNSLNSLSVYFRTIRAIYNRAIVAGIAQEDQFPFKRFKIKSQPTAKRAISFDDVKKLIEVDVSPDEKLHYAQEIFAASFLLMGANFTDLAFLKLENINNNRVRYVRAKTKAQFDIEIPTRLVSVVEKYSKGKDIDDFLFPIVKRDDIDSQYKDIEWARHRYNRELKRLAERAGVEERMTSYVSRHSFASIAKNNEIPLHAISEMLGHKSLKTTQVYLDSLSSDKRDSYHRAIVSF